MEILRTFPGFEIFISSRSDGDFRERSISPEILRPVRQMHQKDIHEINQENRDISFSECDGIYTRSPGIIIATVCADCPVIILMGEGECASLHSGWRGTKVHIAHAGIERFTTSREDIRVYIGPHIGRHSYEVQSDFLTYFPREYFIFSEEKIYFDIEKYIIDDLISLGIQEQNIIQSPRDTFTHHDQFSYRRDGMIGVGIVGVKMC